MARFSKKLKWRFRDFWTLVAGKRKPPEPKTVCVFYCRGCGGHHQLRLQTIGLDGIDLSEFSLQGLKFPCPALGEMIFLAQDDLVFLSEREFDLR